MLPQSRDLPFEPIGRPNVIVVQNRDEITAGFGNPAVASRAGP
jgi:hypothetical protein